MRQLTLKLSLPLFGFCALGVFTGLYLRDRQLYDFILTWLAVKPFRYPFFDFQYILAGAECWRQGVDVYISDPCDLLGRVHGYSPLWLRLPWVSVATSTNICGFGILASFFLSLLCLPPPRDRIDLAVMLGALSSTMTLFALERANVDVIMFVLVAVGVVLVDQRWPRAALGYAFILLAGLLKFYPLVVLGVGAREPLRRLATLIAATVLTLAAFLAGFHSELGEMAGNIPSGPYFTDFFGAINLPWGLQQLFFLWSGGAAESTESRFIYLLPFAILALLVARAVRRVLLMAGGDAARAISTLPQREGLFLIAGAALVSGCFFLGQSVGYRGILLLLVLPGLLALCRAADRRTRRLFTRATLVTLFIMWGDCLRHAVETLPAGAPFWVPFWLLREWLWWDLAGILAGILVCFATETPLWREVRKRLVLIRLRRVTG
jgi:hypothetical protein